MCHAHGTECVFPRAAKTTTSSPRNVSGAKARQARLARRGSNNGRQGMLAGRSTAAASRPSALTRPAEPSDGVRQEQGDHQVTQTPPAGLPEQPCVNDGNRGEALSNLTGIIAETGDGHGSHIVSPAVANDDDVLQSYLSTFPGARRPSMVRASPPNSNRATTTARPVLFNTVPKRPLGVTTNQSVAAAKCDIIEKFIEPGVEDLVDLCVAVAIKFHTLLFVSPARC